MRTRERVFKYPQNVSLRSQIDHSRTDPWDVGITLAKHAGVQPGLCLVSSSQGRLRASRCFVLFDNLLATVILGKSVDTTLKLPVLIH